MHVAYQWLWLDRCNYLVTFTMYLNSMVLWRFIKDIASYQHKSNWLFGHYRTLTFLLSKYLHWQWHIWWYVIAFQMVNDTIYLKWCSGFQSIHMVSFPNTYSLVGWEASGEYNFVLIGLPIVDWYYINRNGLIQDLWYCFRC